jgi:peptidyl-prolyl cis-trans isomerase A (cyclophilin A)
MEAHFETNLGNFKIKLFEDKTPTLVKHFAGLVEGTKEWKDPKTGTNVNRPFYDGLIFHRVIPDFMVQFGCPLGNGTGGPGYNVNDEYHPDLKHDRKGLLSTANIGRPNTNGSQFFITVAATPWLNGGHSIIGEVTEGYDIVEKISKTPKNAQDRPLENVVIKSAKIVK